MHQKSNILSLIKCAFSVFLALCLLFSFGLHALQIKHAHVNDSPHEAAHEHTPDTASLDANMHMADKKIFLFFSSLLLSWLYLRNRLDVQRLQLILSLYLTRARYVQYGNRYRIFDYHSYFFRKGIFHSKAH